MGVFQRVGDIISANLNELLDRFEDPEVMLKQAIREMETSLTQARQEVSRALASEQLARKHLEENETQAQQWRQRAEKAAAAGDDALARKALGRKQDHAKLAAALRDQAEATGETCRALRRQFEALEVKLAEGRRKLATLSARNRAAQVRARVQHALPGLQVSPEPFEQFGRLQKKVERMEAEAEALRELEGGGEHDLDSSAGERGLEEELAALKRKLGK